METNTFFVLKLETLIGSSFVYTVNDAYRISKILNIYVSFDFNGHYHIIRPDINIDKYLEINKKYYL